MEKIYKRPETLAAAPTRYCPGCMHGLISKLIAELVEEYGIANRSSLPTRGMGTWGPSAFRRSSTPPTAGSGF